MPPITPYFRVLAFASRSCFAPDFLTVRCRGFGKSAFNPSPDCATSRESAVAFLISSERSRAASKSLRAVLADLLRPLELRDPVSVQALQVLGLPRRVWM